MRTQHHKKQHTDILADLVDSLLGSDETEIKAQHTEDKMIREHLTEKQVDKMVADSFPASDPPSTY